MVGLDDLGSLFQPKWYYNFKKAQRTTGSNLIRPPDSQLFLCIWRAAFWSVNLVFWWTFEGKITEKKAKFWLNPPTKAGLWYIPQYQSLLGLLSERPRRILQETWGAGFLETGAWKGGWGKEQSRDNPSVRERSTAGPPRWLWGHKGHYWGLLGRSPWAICHILQSQHGFKWKLGLLTELHSKQTSPTSL